MNPDNFRVNETLMNCNNGLQFRSFRERSYSSETSIVVEIRKDGMLVQLRASELGALYEFLTMIKETNDG